MNTKEKNPVLYETLRILIGEALAALLTVGVFWILSLFSVCKFDYTIITGALFGALVIVANFFFLARSTDKIALEALEARGKGEMSEEEIEKFTKEHAAKMNNAIKLSFLLRMGSMIAALVIAFITKWFHPVATLVPLLMLRPVLTVSGLFRRKENTDATGN